MADGRSIRGVADRIRINMQEEVRYWTKSGTSPGTSARRA